MESKQLALKPCMKALSAEHNIGICPPRSRWSIVSIKMVRDLKSRMIIIVELNDKRTKDQTPTYCVLYCKGFRPSNVSYNPVHNLAL